MVDRPEEVEFTEMGKYSSEVALTSDSDNRNGGGCYVSTATGFILILLAVAIAVGVGLIVYFAGPRNFDCKCSPEQLNGALPATAAELVERCQQFAAAGSTEVCSKCATQSTYKPTGNQETTNPSTGNPVTTPVDTTTVSTSTQSVPITTTPKPLVNVRIPLDLYPLNYAVTLRPNLYSDKPEEFTFDGYVRVQMECKKVTNKVYLHIKELTINNASLVFGSDDGGSAPSINSYTIDTELQFIIFHLSGDLQKGKLYYIQMNFTGPLKPDLKGLYYSSYKDGNKTVYLATTQMQPTDARKTFPCFDEPAIKATYDVILERKPHMSSISNMPIMRTDNRADGWVADVYNTTAKMSTYLLAFVVSDFLYNEDYTRNNIRYRTYARPPAIKQAEYALTTGVEILTYFEEYFNVSYPLPKQDMIAVPDFAAGAMENWGLIIYRETAMLFDPKVSSAGNRQRVAVVVSHELAHQWFGNIVTPSWWDDLWLNEGFASYVEYLGVDHVHKDWKMFERFIVDDLQSVFEIDGLVSSHPVYVPVNSPDQINEIFDTISYAKGASIIRMMNFFVGEDTFRRGLTRYLTQLQYGAAFHDDLWYAMGNQTIEDGNRLDVKAIMDTWVLQMNYPVINIQRTATGLRFTQERYLVDPTAPDPGKFVSPFGYKWEVPLTYTHSSAPDFNQTKDSIIWLHKDADAYQLDTNSLPAGDNDSWIIGNVMQYGYYRVNYDISNWRALIKQLSTNHKVIHSTNRAQIINNAWNFAKAGSLDQLTALQTLEYLGNEKEYIVWQTALTQIDYVTTMLTKTSIYGGFTKFMVSILDVPFKDVGMNNTDASHLESLTRSLLAQRACQFGIQTCLDESSALFAQWMKNPDVNPVDPGLRYTVYCSAIEQGGAEEWDFLYGQYKIQNVASEANKILAALTCARETWILSRFLEYSLDPDEVRRQDTVLVIASISNNPVGQSLAWDFLRGQYDVIYERYGEGSFSFSDLIDQITEPFNTEFQLSQLEAFKNSIPNLGTGARAFDQSAERTKSNIKWMERNMPILEKWLQDKNYV